jgi:hypothetical protein
VSRYSILFAFSLLFILFQNFSYQEASDSSGKAALFPKISLDKAQRDSRAPASTDLQDARVVIEEMSHYQTAEPSLVAPQSGHDLNSVAADWAQRQGSAWLGGADKRFVASLNEQLNNWLQGDAPATEPPRASSEVSSPESSTKKNWHFTRINSLQYDMNQGSQLTMHLEGDGGHIDYSQNIDKRTKLGIEHQSANNQTQVLLKYDW